ncbi:hypothetical protein GWI33_006397 [Rhynchophorus ferrugineus]|uniref:Uncharacterized protein n=1 Tax=Rhynchophorus ferrugineus TaxID=354439 RepID=A0A834IF53_RHYFE|nr:hypothetical protein GWI33_006397 [Rhynchophorus ferrugineus]
MDNNRQIVLIWEANDKLMIQTWIGVPSRKKVRNENKKGEGEWREMGRKKGEINRFVDVGQDCKCIGRAAGPGEERECKKLGRLFSAILCARKFWNVQQITARRDAKYRKCERPPLDRYPDR